MDKYQSQNQKTYNGKRTDSVYSTGWTGEQIQKSWIERGVTKETVEFAEKFGKYLAENKFTSNQIRKFYGEVKRQQAQQSNDFNLGEFIMLKPKLAYAVGRADNKNKNCVRDFYNVMSVGISMVTNKNELNNFVKIFEAIVAYHKQNAND